MDGARYSPTALAPARRAGCAPTAGDRVAGRGGPRGASGSSLWSRTGRDVDLRRVATA